MCPMCLLFRLKDIPFTFLNPLPNKNRVDIDNHHHHNQLVTPLTALSATRGTIHDVTTLGTGLILRLAARQGTRLDQLVKHAP